MNFGAAGAAKFSFLPLGCRVLDNKIVDEANSSSNIVFTAALGTWRWFQKVNLHHLFMVTHQLANK
jgi:hypothetical protein